MVLRFSALGWRLEEISSVCPQHLRLLRLSASVFVWAGSSTSHSGSATVALRPLLLVSARSEAIQLKAGFYSSGKTF